MMDVLVWVKDDLPKRVFKGKQSEWQHIATIKDRSELKILPRGINPNDLDNDSVSFDV